MSDDGMTDSKLRNLILDLIDAPASQRQRIEPIVAAELERRGYFDYNGIRYVARGGKVGATLPM